MLFFREVCVHFSAACSARLIDFAGPKIYGRNRWDQLSTHRAPADEGEPFRIRPRPLPSAVRSAAQIRQQRLPTGCAAAINDDYEAEMPSPPEAELASGLRARARSSMIAMSRVRHGQQDAYRCHPPGRDPRRGGARSKVEEFDFESANQKQLRGNIYLAKVTRVEPSLQAAFVDYGGNRHGFLAFSEIHPDYYQIPVADRQALLAEEARAEREEGREEGAAAAADAAGAPKRARTATTASAHDAAENARPRRSAAAGGWRIPRRRSIDRGRQGRAAQTGRRGQAGAGRTGAAAETPNAQDEAPRSAATAARGRRRPQRSTGRRRRRRRGRGLGTARQPRATRTARPTANDERGPAKSTRSSSSSAAATLEEGASAAARPARRRTRSRR